MLAFSIVSRAVTSGLIPILQAIQHEYQYLPEEVLTYVATSLDIPAARVFGVATFYAHFALEPKGKHVIRICDGTACHVKQSLPVLNALRQKLGTTEKSKTTADTGFSASPQVRQLPIPWRGSFVQYPALFSVGCTGETSIGLQFLSWCRR